MATEDNDTEAGGQTEDTGDTGEETEPAEPADTGERQAATEDTGEKPRVPRAQRRAAVVRESAIARAAAEREAADLRARVQRAEEKAEEAQRRVDERERNAQSNDKAPQTKQRISSLRAQARDQIVLAASLKGEAASQAWERHQELMDEADDLRDEIRDEARWTKRRGEIAGSIPNQEMMAERQYLEAKYPQVVTNARARALADATFADLIQQGRPPSRATMEEAITWAAKTLRLGGNSAPGANSRNAYVGMGQRDGEADEGGGGTMSVDDVRNNLALKRMALATFNQDDEMVAYAKFAKQIGTKAMRNGT